MYFLFCPFCFFLTIIDIKKMISGLFCFILILQFMTLCVDCISLIVTFFVKLFGHYSKSWKNMLTSRCLLNFLYHWIAISLMVTLYLLSKFALAFHCRLKVIFVFFYAFSQFQNWGFLPMFIPSKAKWQSNSYKGKDIFICKINKYLRSTFTYVLTQNHIIVHSYDV